MKGIFNDSTPDKVAEKINNFIKNQLLCGVFK